MFCFRRTSVVFCAAVLITACADVSRAAVGDQLHELTPDDPSEYYCVGQPVAIDGNRVVVGAFGYDDSDVAIVFDVATGNPLRILSPSAPGLVGSCGCSLGIRGTTAIMGTIRNDVFAGAAYLYNVDTGNELFKLTANDRAAHDYFGISVAIDNNIAIVGAWGDDDNGTDSGSAYLFNVTTGNQITKLTAPDAAEGDCFGTSVAICGNTAIVGAARADNYLGTAYLFDITTGNQIAKLIPNDPANNSSFGVSVAIHGNTAIVGTGITGDSGSAYLFNVTTGNQIAKLTADDAEVNDCFGYSVGISGNTAIVGAYGKKDEVGQDSGSAYLFDITTKEKIAKLTANDAQANDWFGSAVAIDGNTAVVGAQFLFRPSEFEGKAYLFEAPEPGTLSLLAVGGLAILRRKRS